jgi:hypothetical protein
VRPKFDCQSARLEGVLGSAVLESAVVVGSSSCQAHTILVIAYHLLTCKEVYHDLGATYFDELDRQAVERRLVRRLERLGYQVELTAIPKAA